MDTEQVLDRIAEYPPQKELPVLVTSFAEIIECCREAGREDLVARLSEGDGHRVAEAAASKLGTRLIDGADYWESIPLCVEAVIGG